MNSDHRTQPPEKPPDTSNVDIIQDNQIKRQSNSILKQDGSASIQQDNSTKEDPSGSALLSKLGGPLSQNTLKKHDTILKKVSLTYPENSGEKVNSISQDNPIKQDVDSITQDDQAKKENSVIDDVIVTQQDPVKHEDSQKANTLPTVELPKTTRTLPEVCGQCGRFKEPARCKECGQTVPQQPERCSGCGQIIPETCNACGQVIPVEWLYRDATGHSHSLDRNYYGYYDKWSYDAASCRASTSRKLSRSSGGDSYRSGSCSSQCSCQSTDDYPVNVVEKPCIIADSATLLRRSKWLRLKDYCRRVNRKTRVKFQKLRKPRCEE